MKADKPGYNDRDTVGWKYYNKLTEQKFIQLVVVNDVNSLTHTKKILTTNLWYVTRDMWHYQTDK